MPLYIISLGPGEHSMMTLKAHSTLSKCKHIVGYSGYVHSVSATLDAHYYVYDLGAEQERAEAALNLALSHDHVALISSGDAGIYAMASIVYELVHRTAHTPWAQVEIQMIPGVSAIQALAACCGAPLGHDFCLISLSDLLTPWDVIIKRVEAAAMGDFVIAFYNPKSKARNWQFRSCL